MENPGKIQKQILQAKKAMKNWPEWMKRTARFEGRDSNYDESINKREKNTKTQRTTRP